MLKQQLEQLEQKQQHQRQQLEQKQQRQQLLEQQELQQEQQLQQLELVQERLLLFCCMQLKRLLTRILLKVIFSFVNFLYKDQ